LAAGRRRSTVSSMPFRVSRGYISIVDQLAVRRVAKDNAVSGVGGVS
jgi:hypothetical protein